MIWDYILTFLVGATVPVFISWLQRKDERKKFELERKDKYKLVAIEKRLEAHQQAYFHWEKLISVIHEKDQEKRNSLINNAREFWFSNCLYLEKTTRQEFLVGINRVSDYQTLLAIWKSLPASEEKNHQHQILLNDWESTFKLGDIIQQDVELEPIILQGVCKKGFDNENKI
ncbi:MAG: hypothetical protein Q8N03_08770 [Ignavibacteria bacterium]|nr:hypothetical protein [Ignavibacteria bacterium]MDP3830226.1 hypothetical protein [Ignavibacteriaceae bacterium]